VATLVGACAAPQPAGPPPPAETLFRELVATATATRTLRTAGRVTYWGDDGRVRLRTVVLAERPARFRVETLTPFEEPLDVVASDGDRLYWLSRDGLRIGPATAARLGEVLPLPLSPRAVVDVLLGGIPTDSGWSSQEIEPGEDETWRLTLVDPRRRTARIWVDRDANRVRRIALPRRGLEPEVDITLDDHEGLVARRIEIGIPSRDLSVRIRLESPEYGAPLRDGLFRVTPPPGRSARPW